MGEIVKKSEAKPPAQGGFKGAEYNAVATAARLEKICMIGSKFDVNPEHLDQQGDWKLSYGRKVKSCQFAPESDCVMAVFEYHVTAKIGRSRAMQCTADYVVVYSVPGNSPEPAAQGFCKNVGAFAAYPYFRGLVAHLFAEAGLNIPPLPAIASTAHIPPKPRPKEIADGT
jgi:hypothetical protein